MTIKEMHIALDQGVQYLAANRTRAFHPEEKDLILNKMVNRYITSRLRPRGDGSYEVDSLAQEQLKTLIVQKAGIPAEIMNENEYQVTLPSELGWYITAQASVQDRSCLTTLPTMVSRSRQYHTIKFPWSDKTAPKYYVDAVLGPVSLAALATKNSATWVGLSAKEQVYEVMSLLAGELRSTGVDVFSLYANVLRVVNTVATPLTVSSDAATGTDTVTTDVYNIHISDSTKPAPVRLVPTVQKFELENTPFWRSTPQSILACFVGGNLRLVQPASSIITDSAVIYVKKPRRLSLALNQNSDLPEDYHNDIVDLAVSYIKLELNKPEWEKTLADNKLNTTI